MLKSKIRLKVILISILCSISSTLSAEETYIVDGIVYRIVTNPYDNNKDGLEVVSITNDAPVNELVNSYSLYIPEEVKLHNGTTYKVCGTASNILENFTPQKTTHISFAWKNFSYIGDYAFYWLKNKVKIQVDLPPQCKKVGDFAFAYSPNVSPRGISRLTSIGEKAFAYTNFGSWGISLSDDLEIMGGWNIEEGLYGRPAFQGAKITRFDSTLKHPFLKVYDQDLYNKNLTTLVFVPSGKSSWTPPETLKTIGQEAFCGNYALEQITVPASVSKIGRLAFADCTALKYIVFAERNENDDVLTINSEAFQHSNSNEAFESKDAFVYIKLMNWMPEKYNMDPDALSPEQYKNITLRVPKGYKKSAQVTYPWSRFNRITEFAPESGIETIITDESDSSVHYYNLQGIEVNTPAKGQLLIRLQGNKRTKIIY